MTLARTHCPDARLQIFEDPPSCYYHGDCQCYSCFWGRLPEWHSHEATVLKPGYRYWRILHNRLHLIAWIIFQDLWFCRSSAVTMGCEIFKHRNRWCPAQGLGLRKFSLLQHTHKPSQAGQSVICRLWAVPAFTFSRGWPVPWSGHGETSLMLLLFVVIIRFKHTTTWPSVEVDHDCMGALYALLSFILKMPARPWGSTPLILEHCKTLSTVLSWRGLGEIYERRVKFQFLLFWFQFLTSDYFQVTSAFSMPVVLYLTCWDESIPLYLAVSGPLCPAQKLLCSEDARPPCGPMPLDPFSALMLPHAKLAPPAVLESQRNLNFTKNVCEPCEKWIFSNTTDPVLDAASSGWVQ